MNPDTRADPYLVLRPPPRWRYVFGVLLLVLATFVVYGSALSGDFIWDDDDYVTENEVLRTTDGLRRIWFEPRSILQYYPLVHTSFWVQYQLHGLDPAPYHALNVLLHVFNALLLLALLRYLRVPGAWLAAFVFVLHPINVESVAWITQRKNTLSLFFYLAALNALCRAYRLDGGPPLARVAFTVRYAAGLLLFIGAIFSKTVTCTLPAALLLLVWWKRGTIPWKIILTTLPLFALGVAMGWVTVWLEKYHVLAQGAEWDLSLIERALVAGRVLWFYAGKWVWPVQHTFIYPRWDIDATDAWAYIYPLAAVCFAVGLWALRRRWGRGPLTAVLFYVGTLFPALGFFNVYPMRFSFVADHFQYHAGIGLAVLFAGLLAMYARRVAATMFEREQELTHWIIGALTLPLIGLLGFLAWKQTHIYQNQIALWRDTIHKNPTAWIAYSNLAVVLHREGRVEEAEPLLRHAVQRHPAVLEAPFNLARMLQDMGRYEEAVTYYRRTLDIHPHFIPAYNNLGVVLVHAGRPDEALAVWSAALELDPESVDTHLNLARFMAAQGRFDDAMPHYRRVLEHQPENPDVWFRVGVLLFRQRHIEEAARHFERTLEISPEHADALTNLGLCMGRQGRFADAVSLYDRALGIRPDFAEAWHNRGVALERLDRPREARESYERALQANPDFAPARENLRRLTGH